MAGSTAAESGDVGSRANVFLPASGPEASDADLVDRIIDALYADPLTRAAIEAAGGGAAAGGPRYTSLPELHGGAPPAGMPFFIPDIRMLEVPAPAPGGAAAVAAAIKDVADGIKVEPSVTLSIPEAPEGSPHTGIDR